MACYRFRDLDHVIDEVHALFDAWADGGAFRAVLGADGLDVLRLSVHEWVANLVQHAAFPAETEVRVEVRVEGDAVRCAVEDTSAGFDFAHQLERQRDVLDAPAPSERGRGLLMLVTCAEDLEFRPAAPDADQRIAFALRKPAGGDLGPLFRREDLARDYALVRALGAAPGDGAAGPSPTPAPAAPPDAR
jgi:serine/threonine-protein kinase RsbW